MPDIPAVVLSYLETLSRKDLIELMHSFVLTHEDIRLSIEEKSDMENVKNKNDVATEYSLQILQINRNSTAQEKNQFVYIVIYRPTGCICPAMIILIFIVY